MQNPLSYSIPVTKNLNYHSLTQHYHSLQRCDRECDVLLGVIEAPYLRAYAFHHLLTHLGLGFNTFNAIHKLGTLFIDFPELFSRILTCIGLLSNARLDLQIYIQKLVIEGSNLGVQVRQRILYQN